MYKCDVMLNVSKKEKKEKAYKNNLYLTNV